MVVTLSITIVAYNNYDDIKMAIDSIEKWTEDRLKKIIYIVDNGIGVSDTKEIEHFKNYIKKYSDIEYIDTGENLGFGKGHNYILEKIDSDYHAIVNPDILLCEDSFGKILHWMNEHQDVGMVIPVIIDEEGKRQLVYREELTIFDMFIRFFCEDSFKNRVKKHTMQDKDYSKPFQVPFGQGSFLVIRSKLFKELGGFDEKFFMYVEDADLCKRVNQVSKLMFYPETKVVHKWERGSRKNKKLFKYHVLSILYYFKKWGIRLF